MVFSKCSRQFEQNFCVSEENWCTSCFNMKDYIQALTTELKSAQLIIKILQDELQSKRTEPTTTRNLPKCVNYKPHVKNNSESVSESEWTEFRKNNHKSKSPKNTSRCLKQLTPHIPLGDNRFVPLSNLQDENPVFPANNSCDINTGIGVAQGDTTVCQEVNLNVAISNEPAKCNLRASRPKKPLDKREDFLGY